MTGREYFGTDGVRGIVPEELSLELAIKLGQAAQSYLGEKNCKVAVGTDTRLSKDCVESALVAGITSCGGNVLKLGVLPSPGVSFMVKELGCSYGAVISASHNPFQYNGIKFFDKNGFKLSDTDEIEIENIIRKADFEFSKPERIGKTFIIEYSIEKYTSWIEQSISRISSDLKLIIDCANGATSEAAMTFSEKTGLNADFICTEPDGKNINKGCGATSPEKLVQRVKTGDYDGGISFDGDGDRLIVVDEVGKVLDGDHIIGFLSDVYKSESLLSENVVVTTKMSNMGLEVFLKEKGIKLERADVGDRYVLEKMLNRDAVVGGEQSGHIILLDKANTGDGLLVAAVFLEAISKRGLKISEARMFENYPQVQKNVEVSRKKELYKKRGIVKAIENAESQLGDEGRILVRPSGTEPLVRVMVEAQDRSKAEEIANMLAKTIEEALS